MVGGDALGGAVAALQLDAGGVEGRRHGLGGDGAVELAPLQLHVDGGAGADGAAIRCLHVARVAGRVHVVAAGHGDDAARGREHVVAADGAVAFGRAFDAPVVAGEADGDADVAALEKGWVSN